MIKKGIGFLAVIIVLTNVYVAPPASAAPKKTYTLSFLVASMDWTSLAYNEADARKPSSCYPGKYSKLTSGAILKITNQNGKLLAIGKTVWKVIEVTDQLRGDGELYYEGLCALVTTVKKLPKAEIYQLMLGTVDAGAYTFQELVADKWKVSLSYG